MMFSMFSRLVCLGLLLSELCVLYDAVSTCGDSEDKHLCHNIEKYCRTIRRELAIPSATKSVIQPKLRPWWMYYWEPNWSCAFEERIMWMNPNALVTAGDGGKWTCDVPSMADRDCLVYSFGSSGDFSFEVGLLERLQGGCEVHTFDITNLRPDNAYPAEYLDAIHKHMWGLGAVDEVIYLMEHGERVEVQMKTLLTIMELLGHTGRTLTVLKVDIEGGEFGLLNNHTFWREFDRSGAHVEQLLFELHFEHSVHFGDGVTETGSSIDEFFRALSHEGFALFHKEINMLSPTCSEFSMLRNHISCPAQEVQGDLAAVQIDPAVVDVMIARMTDQEGWLR